MCHVCQKVYCQASTLSKHLKTRHKLEWPSGHSRFRYKLESDGYYRLQTLRYESIELIEQLNKTANNDINSNDSNHGLLDLNKIVEQTTSQLNITNDKSFSNSNNTNDLNADTNTNTNTNTNNTTLTSNMDNNNTIISCSNITTSTVSNFDRNENSNQLIKVNENVYDTNNIIQLLNQNDSVQLVLNNQTELNSNYLINNNCNNQNQQQNNKIEFDLERYFDTNFPTKRETDYNEKLVNSDSNNKEQNQQQNEFCTIQEDTNIIPSLSNAFEVNSNFNLNTSEFSQLNSLMNKL